MPPPRVTPRTPGTGARAVILPDGRAVEFALLGDPHGTPVVAVHPLPGSHALWRASELAAARAGVLVVAPDRPGCGRSDPLPDGAALAPVYRWLRPPADPDPDPDPTEAPRRPS